MPTGYTAAVQSGEITELRDFALACARAFGACVTMRDDPADRPIPERFEPDTRYHDAAIAAAQHVLDELPGLSDDECARRAMAAHADALDRHREYARRQEVQRVRYAAMIAKVEAWDPSPEVAELRAFMLSQLYESVRFDCRASPLDDEPAPLAPKEWRAGRLAEAARDLTYHLAKRQEEVDRVAARNRWLAALRASLGDA